MSFPPVAPLPGEEKAGQVRRESSKMRQQRCSTPPSCKHVFHPPRPCKRPHTDSGDMCADSEVTLGSSFLSCCMVSAPIALLASSSEISAPSNGGAQLMP